MSGTSASFVRGGNQGTSFFGGLLADELMNWSSSPEQKQFYNNSLLKNNSVAGQSLWIEPYKYIFSSNSILEGIAGNTALSVAVKAQLEGEARFIRAYCYFYLINFYGEVPLVTGTDYRVNAILPRTTIPKIYDLIKSDLQSAYALLPDSYAAYNGERTRPIRFAAAALLARVLLYTSDPAAAETQASLVLNNNGLYRIIAGLDSVFLKNSNEAIWQLQPVVAGVNTQDGFYFVLSASPTNATISTQLFNAFEPGDKRKTSWIGAFTTNSGTFYYPAKYKIKSATAVTEYSMILRLAETLLVRAEARAMQGKLTGALEDINTLRARAGLSAITVMDKASILAGIEHERQTELFTEWGHRWFDLKRTGRAGIVLGAIKAPNWQAADTLLPIPLTEINSNPNLTQNPGY